MLGKDDPAASSTEAAVVVRDIEPYGDHQPAVAAASPKHAELVALTLLSGTDRAALGRLMRLWTADIVALSAGRPAPGDTAPELALPGVALTTTVGFGPRVFSLPGLAGLKPGGLDDLPVMSHDRLQPAWSGGDLLLLVGADDPVSVVHAVRRLVADAAPFARPVWRQTGFWNGAGADRKPVTGRNLFGQVDGTGNPAPGTPEFDSTVWSTDGLEWFRGGTTLVVRRIRMNLDTWDELTRSEQERAVGRKLSTGAPLTGSVEHDELDLEKRDADGRLVIAENAHARLSHHSTNDGRRIFRKGLNYVQDTGATRESGLIFLSYQADIAGQFLPLLARLDAADALNEWTTTIGSAVFAIPPGFHPDEWLAQALLR
ncbi:dye decolorizing peroxidase [Kribbella orskensis]|uniref:Dye decolorizing peroxidase n=1 Tax=Kribbella orskensis TaxID=2512216 RepID=A0ABY2BEA1_9ACTN|nr:MULTISPECIES: Dyp-type peroxidase [Kribbella]TCN35908.1 dye decolorizing peroxidase [Kribbella sp. VKM Ac-2500]TCO17515.1 dye decolorizing peroxidase [Kribbella orskensis]